MFRTLVYFDCSTKGRLKKVLRYTLIFLSTTVFVTGLDTAAALDPSAAGARPWTYFESAGENGIPSGNPDGAGRNRAYYGSDANGPGYGSSFWSYADTFDAARKPEGSYAPFTGANGWNKDGTQRSDNLGTYSETQTATRTIGVLSDPGVPIWTVPYASELDTETVAVSGTDVRSIVAEDGSTPFRAYARSSADGLVVTIGDDATETTTGLSRPFFSIYEGAAVTATYTGLGPGPHAGYSESTNKCQTCHAVHRAGGARHLGRADTREAACDYCHTGEHRHAGLESAEATASASIEGHGFDTSPTNDWTASGHDDIPY